MAGLTLMLGRAGAGGPRRGRRPYRHGKRPLLMPLVERKGCLITTGRRSKDQVAAIEAAESDRVVH